MKNFDFDNDTSENISLQPYISYMANERLLYGETISFQETIFGNDSRFHAKIRLIIAPQKQIFAMAKILSKHYALDCSCTYPWTFLHSYT